jgi:deoxyribodipyrimidine photo-lyase
MPSSHLPEYGPDYGLHWFRRDLRIAGNPALLWSWKRHQGRVLGIFTFDQKFLARDDFSHNRFAFFLETLKILQSQLRELGGDLLFLDVGPDEGFEKLFCQLKQRRIPLPKTISFNRDYEPYAIRRDSRMETFLKGGYDVEIHSERDHLLIEPHELLKQASPSNAKNSPGASFYQVYSPFQKAWMKQFRSARVQERIQAQKQGLIFLNDFEKGKKDTQLFSLTWEKLLGSKVSLKDPLESYRQNSLRQIQIQIPKSGSLRAHEKILQFRDHGLNSYAKNRDFPGVPGTSQMSIFLKNGSITIAQIIAACGLADLSQYLNELIWREFYYHILAHRPDVETEPFQKKYRKLKWKYRESHFKAWQEGRTGYPIVDAGMRQLSQTGWMHNRVRMIVASFLTKDLLIDYRWGENHFMKLLLDGDLAPNNGGWQWSASTGSDPQPFFRIFNPILQSRRFDPKGDYIRRWVPELKNFDARDIHEPWNSGQRSSYPKPIVNHAEQKEKALAMFKAAGK